jgi:hypothetical protein
MTLAIMQPTYLPWAGYFNLISRVECFVFLNNVKIEKSSWQVRNRVLLNSKAHVITVPILGSREQRIDEVQINGHAWRQKHVRILQQAYAKHPHGPEVVDCVAGVILDESIGKLEQLNTQLVSLLCTRLGLECRFFRASEVPTVGKRSDRLVELCRHFGQGEYLSPAGSRAYIEADRAFEQANIPVEFQAFVPAPYVQRGAPEFVPSLSIVDVAANLGWCAASDYVRGGAPPARELHGSALRSSLSSGPLS